ncbi:MAG: hypothetical protein IPK74_18885 [Deltaproteobacteria bacterium]|nr:hypothetical protein [Deltaproteobacteria bacterium]
MFRPHRHPSIALLGPILAVATLLASACAPETPPKPDAPAKAGDDPATPAVAATWTPSTPAVLTFAAERGSFADAGDAAKIPEASRGLVRVSLLDGPAPPPGMVWVGNFRDAQQDGSVALTTVPRDAYEELALGQGLSSSFELPQGLQPPQQVAPSDAEVIVYKTAWCGVCKKLEGYLKKKGVAYVAKDIEKDRDAAAELQAKAAAKHVQTGSVPIVDVRGELLVGFDRARLEQLL